MCASSCLAVSGWFVGGVCNGTPAARAAMMMISGQGAVACMCISINDVLFYYIEITSAAKKPHNQKAIRATAVNMTPRTANDVFAAVARALTKGAFAIVRGAQSIQDFVKPSVVSAKVLCGWLGCRPYLLVCPFDNIIY